MVLDNVIFLSDKYSVQRIHKDRKIYQETILINKNNIEQGTSLLSDPNSIRICKYVYGLLSKEQQNKDRSKFYEENPNGIDLMSFFDKSTYCGLCRERSILLHILLAQIGISTSIISAETPDHKNRHAFLIDASMGIYDPENMDPAKIEQPFKIQSSRSYCLNTLNFNTNIESVQIALPKSRLNNTIINYAGTNIFVYL